MTLNRTLLLGITLACAASNMARAELTLVLDTAAKNLWFTGSATGTPGFNPVGPTYEVFWFAGSGGSTENFIGIDDGYITPTGNTFQTPDSGFLSAFDGPGSRVALSLFFVSGSTVFLQGIGSPATAEYYGDWGAGQQTRLESYIGSSLPLGFGTGFGALAVVPEPRISGLVASLGLVAFAAYRGRGHHARTDRVGFPVPGEMRV